MPLQKSSSPGKLLREAIYTDLKKQILSGRPKFNLIFG